MNVCVPFNFTTWNKVVYTSGYVITYIIKTTEPNHLILILNLANKSYFIINVIFCHLLAWFKNYDPLKVGVNSFWDTLYWLIFLRSTLFRVHQDAHALLWQTRQFLTLVSVYYPILQGPSGFLKWPPSCGYNRSTCTCILYTYIPLTASIATLPRQHPSVPLQRSIMFWKKISSPLFSTLYNVMCYYIRLLEDLVIHRCIVQINHDLEVDFVFKQIILFCHFLYNVILLSLPFPDVFLIERRVVQHAILFTLNIQIFTISFEQKKYMTSCFTNPTFWFLNQKKILKNLNKIKKNTI